MKYTQNFIRSWWLEGTMPLDQKVTIFWKYQITTDGKVLGQSGEPLNYIFKQSNGAIPYVLMSIRKKDSDGTFNIISKEVNVLSLMAKYFGPYIIGYGDKTLFHDEKFKIIQKEQDGNDFSIKNLQFVKWSEYDPKGTTKRLISSLLSGSNWLLTDQEIADRFGVSVWWVNRIRSQRAEVYKGEYAYPLVQEAWLQDITFDGLPIYEALLSCDGQKSNLEIAKELRPDKKLDDQDEQPLWTDKVMRVRKKLSDKWLISQYNTYGKSVSIASVREKLTEYIIKNNSFPKQEKKTAKQIAALFGLDLNQVQNFSKQLKKQ